MCKIICFYILSFAISLISCSDIYAYAKTEEEVKVGKKIYHEILKSIKLYDDPQLQSYVNAVGKKVAASTERPNLNYVFHIIDSPGFNAFAIQGGFIFIERGLMAFLNNEDELAAVLGHEIAHVTKRHAIKQKNNMESAGMASGFFGGLSNNSVRWIRGYGRKNELEADLWSIRYLKKSGYEPRAMLDLINVMKNRRLFLQKDKKGSSKATKNHYSSYATHPSDDRRLRRALSEAKQQLHTSVRKPVSDYMTNINGLAYGPLKSSGFDKNNVYFNSKLKIVIPFPKEWQTSVRGSRLISLLHPDPRFGYVYVQVEKKAKKTNSYISKNISSGYFSKQSEFTNSNGYKGYKYKVETPKDFWLRSQAAVILIGNNSYLVFGEVRDKTLYIDWLKGFAKILDSIRDMQAEESFHVIDKYIKLHTVQNGETYSSLSALNKNNAEIIKLLNADYPNGEIVAGEQIKIIAKN